MRTLGAVLLLALLAALLLPVLGSLPSPEERRTAETATERILQGGSAATGASNYVTAVLFDYRGLDTLGEATVIFAAVAGIVMLFSRRELPTSQHGLSILAKRNADFLNPFIFLTGLFIVVFGHVSPGGGFQGGVVWATVSILACVVYGTTYEEEYIHPNAKTVLESAGALSFLALGLVGIFSGTFFLSNLRAGFSAGTPGTLLSAGMIPFLNLAIGCKVGAGLALIFYSMMKKEPR